MVPSAPVGRPVPAGTRLRADRSLHVGRGGSVLSGGRPARLLRLRPAGAEAVRRWLAGGAVGDEPAHRRLARRLVDAGMVHPVVTPAAAVDDVTVVVPVRDRPAALRRCLAALRASTPGIPIVVVDDGSIDWPYVEAVAGEVGAALVRHRRPRGPAAARNAGLARTATPYVAFVDSDVVVTSGWLERLRPHLSDGTVAAVAPRVLAHEPDGRWLSAYEQAHSALDMGPHPARVRPGSAVPFVPTAALLARRAAVGAGFDETLSTGEDVDLVWRLVERGWTVRYDPDVTVEHQHRTGVREFAATRYRYARSVGALSRRHPAALPAARVSPGSAAAWLLLAAGRPGLALTVVTATAARLAQRIDGSVEQPAATAARLTARGFVATGLGLADAVRRVWWPALLVAGARRPTARRGLGAAVVAAAAYDWARAGRRPGLHAYVPARCLDDLASTAGLWHGCLTSATVRPLLPAGARDASHR